MPETPTQPSRPIGALALAVALFFVSGAAGLVYEVLWSRMLSLEMGSTAYALGTILTVFMGGLALGSAIGGRFGSKIVNPLRAYALLELGIGVYCLATPLLIELLHPAMRVIYQQFEGSLLLMSLAQAVLCAIVLAPPVLAMGATFPILAQFVTRSPDRVSGSVGTLYGVNTFGAFAGAVSTGLFLIPALGVTGTNHLAVGMNLAVGVVALLAARRIAPSAAAQETPVPEASDEAEQPSGPPVWLLLAGFALSGFAAMTLQTAWTRLMSLSIGSATYAFSLIVGAFILGLAVGAAVIGRLGDKPGRALSLLVISQFGIALTAAITIPLFGALPLRVSMLIAEHPGSLTRIQAGEFVAIALIVLPPTFLLGGILPLVCQCVASASPDRTARIVGRVYASNTVGAILGSALAGFALIPTIGMRGSIVVGVLCNAIVGAAYLATGFRKASSVSRGMLAGLGLVVSLVVVVAMPPWDKAVLTSGSYINAIALSERSQGDTGRLREFLNANSDIVFYKEGVATTVTVRRIQNEPWLLVSGKLEASSFEFTQAYLAHLPLLLHPDPRSALVIGLGSGCTLNSAALHRGLERIDCVEISPGVIEAAERFFDHDDIFTDERVRIIEGDGRLRLAMTDQTYDVIISQPSNPWMAGASSMFTRECFESMRDRLSPGGVVCVWFQGFQVSPETLRTIVGTFGDVFPAHDLWASRIGGDYLLTGSMNAAPYNVDRVRAGIADRGIGGELARDQVRSVADFLGRRLAGSASCRAFSEGADRNTDDRTILEDRIPRELFADHFASIIDATATLREPITAPEAPMTAGMIQRLDQIEEAKRLVIEAFQASARGDAAQASTFIARARALDPNNYWCRDAASR